MEKADWFLLYTKPRQEDVARSHLARQDFETYLPFTTQRRIWRGRWQQVTEPMFPRYLFIRLNEISGNWAPIRSTIGVTGLVRFGMSPARVPGELILALQRRAEPDGLFRPKRPDWAKGERVRIVSGVLAGYEAVFEARTGVDRVKVLMDLIGSHSLVDVDEKQLARAS